MLSASLVRGQVGKRDVEPRAEPDRHGPTHPVARRPGSALRSPLPRPRKAKMPPRGMAFLLEAWLPDLGSNQGHTD